jgi:hypothetical protein
VPTARQPPAPALHAGELDPVPFHIAADVSAAVIADFRQEQLGILTRAILRAATKYVLSHEVERQTRRRPAAQEDEEEDDEEEEPQRRERESWWLSVLLGTLFNVGGAVLEQADTRAWNLLPERIGIARVQLPAGRHTLRIQAPGGIGVAPRALELGPVDVRAGEFTFLSERVWR